MSKDSLVRSFLFHRHENVHLKVCQRLNFAYSRRRNSELTAFLAGQGIPVPLFRHMNPFSKNLQK